MSKKCGELSEEELKITIEVLKKHIKDNDYWLSDEIETLLNAYLREKAKADKLEEDYSKALTKIEELGGNADAIIK